MRVLGGGHFIACESGATYSVALTAQHDGANSCGFYTISKGIEIVERGEHSPEFLQCEKQISDAAKHICAMAVRQAGEKPIKGIEL